MTNEHPILKESKMKVKSALILMMLATSIFYGCATSGQHRQSFSTSNPRLDRYNKEATKSDLPFFISMTSDQVIATLGTPYNINHSVGSDGVREQWVYNINSRKGYPTYGAKSCNSYIPTHYMYFENGRLIDWEVR